MTDQKPPQRYTLAELLVGLDAHTAHADEWPEPSTDFMADRTPTDVLHALDAAIRLHDGDLRRAIAWLQKPAIGLGDVAPIDHLDTPERISAVLDLIGRIEHGVGI